MVSFFSWDGLDRALSDRAQSLFIFAAALANLIFLNKYIRAALEDFLSEFKKGPGCELFMDSAEAKLLYLYLSIFFLGVCALIVKSFMPQELKLYPSKDAYVESLRNSSKQEIYEHYEKSLNRQALVSTPRKKSIISMVESAQQLDEMTEQDINNYSREYFSHFYDYKKTSFLFAPLAKFLLALSALIFCVQALRTFVAVMCIEMKSFGLLA
jgi:hypothetical protein